MAKANKQKTKAVQAKKTDWRDYFKHGSGGHLAVLGIITLMTVALAVYASSQGNLERYYLILGLLVVMLVVQLVLFFRINRTKDK